MRTSRPPVMTHPGDAQSADIRRQLRRILIRAERRRVRRGRLGARPLRPGLCSPSRPRRLRTACAGAEPRRGCRRRMLGFMHRPFVLPVLVGHLPLDRRDLHVGEPVPVGARRHGPSSGTRRRSRRAVAVMCRPIVVHAGLTARRHVPRIGCLGRLRRHAGRREAAPDRGLEASRPTAPAPPPEAVEKRVAHPPSAPAAVGLGMWPVAARRASSVICLVGLFPRPPVSSRPVDQTAGRRC